MLERGVKVDEQKAVLPLLVAVLVHVSTHQPRPSGASGSKLDLHSIKGRRCAEGEGRAVMACSFIVSTHGEQGLCPEMLMHDIQFDSKCIVTLAAQTARSSQQPAASGWP